MKDEVTELKNKIRTMVWECDSAYRSATVLRGTKQRLEEALEQYTEALGTSPPPSPAIFVEETERKIYDAYKEAVKKFSDLIHRNMDSLRPNESLRRYFIEDIASYQTSHNFLGDLFYDIDNYGGRRYREEHPIQLLTDITDLLLYEGEYLEKGGNASSRLFYDYLSGEQTQESLPEKTRRSIIYNYIASQYIFTAKIAKSLNEEPTVAEVRQRMERLIGKYKEEFGEKNLELSNLYSLCKLYSPFSDLADHLL